MAVRLTVPEDSGQNRLWGIPWFGIAVRWVLCIPQFVILFVLGIVMYLIVLVDWIPVLINGRQASWATGVFRTLTFVQSRTVLYLGLATGAYPGFGDTPGHPVAVTVDEDAGQNRLWGIPFLGILARLIVCIPHFIVLWVLGLVSGLLFLVSWIPVLVNGRQAGFIVQFLASTYRYGLRVAAYLVLVTGEYPPFRLED